MTDRPFPKPIRLNAARYTEAATTFHIVIRALPGRRPFPGAVGAAVWKCILSQTSGGTVVVVAACLMPDHPHLLARPEHATLLDWVARFKSLTTRAAWSADWQGPLWQPRFFDGARSVMGSSSRRWAYIVNNPIAAGLVEGPNGWPWLFVDDG